MTIPMMRRSGRGVLTSSSSNVSVIKFCRCVRLRSGGPAPPDRARPRSNGYGEWVNDLDDDTTNTLLADPEIPLPGGNGFAYLVSWVDLEGERGMGTTSAGLPRDDVLPCP